MKTLITLLLLISTPLLAQTPRGQTTPRQFKCDADLYALGRPTTEQLQARTKQVPAVEHQVCRSVAVVNKVADEGGDVEINQQFVTTYIALTTRIEALEEHMAAETQRIDSNIQNINVRLQELNSRPAYAKPAQQYTPPTVTMPDYGTAPSEPVRKPNKWDNAENNLK